MTFASRFALIALVAAAAVVGMIVLASGGDDRYRLRVQLANAGGLLKGSAVRIDGVPVGKVTKLDLDDQDRPFADLRLDKQVSPVGRNARAEIVPDGLLGERYVDLSRGTVDDALPTGSVLPRSRTSVSVRFDDLIDAADTPTRQALSVFLGEQGAALVGRGGDLGQTLAALPPTLTSTRHLVDEFATDRQALAGLVEASDRVLASVARERPSLGRFVKRAAGTLDTLASRRAGLGATIERAPAALASARRALTSLEGAAVPLIPAARGLRSAAPSLAATLRELPRFAQAANPALDTIREVSPQLARLGRQGAPHVRRLRPLTSSLSTYAPSFDRFTTVLDRIFGDLLGVMEGWARSTQPNDAASHVFRFGVSNDPSMLKSLLPVLPQARHDRKRKPNRSRPHTTPPDASQQPPGTHTPDGPTPKSLLDNVLEVPKTQLPAPPEFAQPVGQTVKDVLDKLLGSR